jgi:two-component system LytT family response regulator
MPSANGTKRSKRGEPHFIQRIPVRTGAGYRIIPVGDLVSAVAHDEVVHLTTSTGERLTLTFPLTELEAKLDPAIFIRLSRSTLVNVNFVKQVTPQRSGLLRILLSTGDELLTSRMRGRALRHSLLSL